MTNKEDTTTPKEPEKAGLSAESLAIMEVDEEELSRLVVGLYKGFIAENEHMIGHMISGGLTAIRTTVDCYHAGFVAGWNELNDRMEKIGKIERER